MAKPKPILIVGSIIGVLVVASGVVLPWYFVVYKNQPSDYPTWDLMFFGSPVETSVNMTYEYIRTEFNLTEYYGNTSFTYTQVNDGISTVVNFTGMALWDLIVNSSVDYGSADAVRFVGIDGTVSPILSLDNVQYNSTRIVVYFIKGDDLLQGPPRGNGYLGSAVDFKVDETTNSSEYNIDGLVGIEFLIL